MKTKLEVNKEALMKVGLVVSAILFCIAAFCGDALSTKQLVLLALTIAAIEVPIFVYAYKHDEKRN